MLRGRPHEEELLSPDFMPDNALQSLKGAAVRVSGPSPTGRDLSHTYIPSPGTIVPFYLRLWLRFFFFQIPLLNALY